MTEARRYSACNDLDAEMAFAAERVGDQAREFGLFQQLLRAFDIRALGHMEFGVRVKPGEAHLAVDTIQRAFGARLEAEPRVFRRRRYCPETQHEAVGHGRGQ